MFLVNIVNYLRSKSDEILKIYWISKPFSIFRQWKKSFFSFHVVVISMKRKNLEAYKYHLSFGKRNIVRSFSFYYIEGKKNSNFFCKIKTVNSNLIYVNHAEFVWRDLIWLMGCYFKSKKIVQQVPALCTNLFLAPEQHLVICSGRRGRGQNVLTSWQFEDDLEGSKVMLDFWVLHRSPNSQ